jgi:hypothetical protein
MGMLDIADGIKHNLQAIHGLRIFSTKELPDSINQFPTALILPGETGYVTTLSSTDSDYNFRIILVFSRADSPSTASKMLPFIDTTGDESIVEKIHDDLTLSDTAETCKVTRNLGIGSLSWGGETYMSTEFQVQVWANN